MKKRFLSALRKRVRAALHPSDIDVATFALTMALTGVGCLVAWKLALLLESPLVLAIMFAVPIVAGAHSPRLCLASLITVMVAAFVFLPGIAGPGLIHAVAGVGATAAICVAIVVARAITVSRTAETEAALNHLRATSRRTYSALSRAGICILALNKGQAWVEVNEAAWAAFGCDPRITRLAAEGIPIEDDVASALMHPGSRESWRMLLGLVKADLAYLAPRASGANALLPYETILYSMSGERTSYRFRVSVNEDNELTFIGTPSSETAVDQDLITQKWLADVVDATDEPAAILLSDGSVLAANWDFRHHAGRVRPGTRIFDLPAVSGVDERTFTATVWSATRHQDTTLLPFVLLGVGQGYGLKLAPPGSPHLEAVMVIFRAPETGQTPPEEGLGGDAQ